MKYRHELKYIISATQAEILKQRLSLVMEVDQNSVNSDHTYRIRSLYFDDIFSKSYYEKLDGVLYRKKYRIRIYNQDDQFIRLECKYKHNNLTSKEQAIITKELCFNLMNQQTDFTTDNPFVNRFLGEMKAKHLIPSVIVDYKRLAFTYPISDVRITFDSHIQSGKYNYDLFDYTKPLFDVIENNIVVLEVKFNEVLPSHIAIILETIPSFRQAVSKFALCREVK